MDQERAALHPSEKSSPKAVPHPFPVWGLAGFGWLNINYRLSLRGLLTAISD
jgi:hypothetical protein